MNDDFAVKTNIEVEDGKHFYKSPRFLFMLLWCGARVSDTLEQEQEEEALDD